MKFLVNIVLCMVLCIATGVCGASQQSPKDVRRIVVEDIGKLSIPEAKIYLNDWIAELNNYLVSTEKMKKTIFKFSPVNDDISQKLVKYNVPFKIKTTQQMLSELDKTKDKKFFFDQFISGSRSIITPDIKNLIDIIEGTSKPGEISRLEYKVLSLYFRDGSEKKFETKDSPCTADDGYCSGYRFSLPTDKPIDHIDLTFRYSSYPSYQKYILNKNNTSEKGDNHSNYQLTSIQNNTATLQLSMPKSYTYLVDGLTEDGKTLARTGSNSVTLPDTEEIRKYYQELIKVRDSIELFSDSKKLQDHIEDLNLKFHETSTNRKIINESVHFSAQPQSIWLYVFPEKKYHTYNQSLSNFMPEQRIYIAEGDSSKSGFVDVSGNWVIEPQFNNLQVTAIDNIYRAWEKLPLENSEGFREISFFISIDPKDLKIQRLPFYSILEKTGEGQYLVQKENNGSYGIYNFKTQKYIFPMKFGYAKIVNDIIILSLGEDTYNHDHKFGVYTLTGQELLPMKYSRINHAGGYLYIRNEDFGPDDVYSLHGKKLNPPGYEVIGKFNKEQPLVMQNRVNDKYKILSMKGNILSVDLPYERVMSFSNGMAIVTRDGVSGAINSSGKLTVPLLYKKIYPFQEKYAAAVSSNGLILIDKNNKFIKNLGVERSVIKDDNTHAYQYIVEDPQQTGYLLYFDNHGNQIKRERDKIYSTD